jgi:hypothetical protein
LPHTNFRPSEMGRGWPLGAEIEPSLLISNVEKTQKKVGVRNVFFGMILIRVEFHSSLIKIDF